MNFSVQFLGEAGAGGGKPRVLRTASFEAEDLYGVVARMRIILSLRSYEPSCAAFQIVSNDGRVIHHERRDEIDGSYAEPSPSPGPSGSLASLEAPLK
jgi:hypothetical protein